MAVPFSTAAPSSVRTASPLSTPSAAVASTSLTAPSEVASAVAELLAGLVNPPEVVLVSSREASVFGSRLRRSPARGFLVKGDLSGDALRRLLAG